MKQNTFIDGSPTLLIAGNGVLYSWILRLYDMENTIVYHETF